MGPPSAHKAHGGISGRRGLHDGAVGG